MSTNESSPNIETNETNVQNNLSTQSGYPNMSNEKTFIVQNGLLVDGDAVVTGTVTATSFIGDGSQLTGISGGGGGGLDSAGVQLLIDAEVQDPTTLTLGASSNAGIGIGSGVVTNGLSGGSVSIGTNANSYLQSVAIGSGANASGTGSVSVGPNTQSSGNFNTAIGREATTSGSNSLALGYSSSAGNYGIALGDAASGQRSIAIGALASATGNGALHINANYNSGVGPTAGGGLVIETASARLEYSADSDWVFNAPVTSSEFKFADGTSMTTAPTGGGSGGLDSAAVNAIIDSDFNDPQQLTFGGEALAITVGKEAATHSSGGVAIGSNADASGGVWNLAIGNGAKADTVIGASALGHNALARGSYATAIGRNAVASTTYAQALGYTATASGYGSLAVGWGGEASGQEAVGVQGVASGSQSVAVGKLATASGNESIAIGKGATASQVNSIAIGGDNNTFARSLASICIGEDADNADATNNYSIVIGKDASVTGTNNPDTVTIGRASRAGGSYAIGLGYLSRADAENALVINASGTNREVTSQFGIDIRTSAAGSLTYDTTNDWTFGAGVTMTDLTASGATVVFSNLPTTDPVNAGQLWNDAGTLKVSAG